MKNAFLVGTLGCAGLLAGCTSGDNTTSDPNTLVKNDFETIFGWVPEAQSATITKEKAHSGVYSLKVDGNNEYSLGFRAPLGKLSSRRVTKIKVSAWTFATSPAAQASLVIAVSDPATPNGKPLLWEGIELNKSTESGKWVELNKEITLPATVAPSNLLGAYLWRTSGDQPVYLDDLQLTVVP